MLTLTLDELLEHFDLKERVHRDWQDEGLQIPPDSDGRYHDEHVERAGIIKGVLRIQRSFTAAAYELFLNGYTLPPGYIVKALSHYLDDRQRRFTQRRHRQREMEDSLEYARLTKNANNALINASPELRLFMVNLMASYTGEAYPIAHTEWKSFPSLINQREIIRKASACPEQIIEAEQNSRKFLTSTPDVGSLLAFSMGVSTEDFVRAVLPMHACVTRHAPEHAIRPDLTILSLMPKELFTNSLPAIESFDNAMLTNGSELSAISQMQRGGAVHLLPYASS